MTTKSSTEQPTQALATSDKSTVITSPDEYRGNVTKWQRDQYHILSPYVQVAAIPSNYVLLPTFVVINPDPAYGEVYKDKLFCDDDEVALSKNGLSKIALAAGMSIKTERVDDRSIQNYWEVRATARFMGLDGTVQEIDNMADYDLRDGAPRIEKIKAAAKRNNRNPEAQIQGARQYGLRGCEARAINAVIRQYGIRQKYAKNELSKPFVAIRMHHRPDMTNPAVAAIMTERAAAGTSTLFPSAPMKQIAPVEPETISVIQEAAPGQKQPEPGGRTVARFEHDVEAGIYWIFFEDDQTEYGTKDQKIVDAAIAAKKGNYKVVAKSEDREGVVWLVSLEPLDAPKPKEDDGKY